jgi:mannobiose 2-epimerase
MNTHLHIIEPYTNLLRVWRSDELLEATETLLNLFLDTIEDPAANGHLGLFFDDDWNRQDRMLSYGHDIEASWLLLETAQVINKPELLEKTLSHTERIAHAALEGRCSDGSMVYERHNSGDLDSDKHWWVQAECVIGQLYLYRFHGHKEMLEQSYQTWKYILQNLVDPAGEWHWSMKSATNTVNLDDDKAGFWKCPYHNSRMCLEVYERLAE